MLGSNDGEKILFIILSNQIIGIALITEKATENVGQ